MSLPVVLLRPRPMAHRGLAPGGLRRHAGGGLALAAAVRMVPGVHDHAAHLGPLALVARAPGLAQALVLMIEVADLADGRHAAHVDPAHLARRQPDLGASCPPWPGAGPTAPAERTIWPPLPGTSSMLCSWVPSGIDASGRALPTRASAVEPAIDRVADLEAVRHQDVALLAVRVVQQSDARRAVGVVLDRGQLRRHVPLVAPEVDATVVALLAAAAMADRQATLVVAPAPPLLGLEQRLVRRVGGDLLEGRAGHEPPTGRGRLVASQRHRLDPLEELDLVAGGDRHDGLLPGRGEALDAAALAVAALLLGLRWSGR